MFRTRSVALWTTGVLAAAALAGCADSEREGGESDSGEE